MGKAVKLGIAGLLLVGLAIAGVAFYLHSGHLSRAEAKEKLSKLITNVDDGWKPDLKSAKDER